MKQQREICCSQHSTKYRNIKWAIGHPRDKYNTDIRKEGMLIDLKESGQNSNKTGKRPKS
jgi:hypothetical protein